MATSDDQQLTLHRGMGHVIDVFPPDQIARLKGHNAIGHVRYSTAGGSMLKNAQPIAVEYARGSIAIAHNGNLTNAETVKERLEERGSIFQSTSDTEVIVHLVAISEQRTPEDRIADALANRVKLRDRPVPIQKMITVPILNADEAIGVAQISRKGESPAEAGPDFSGADVRKAEDFFRQVAPYLVKARPDRF